MLVGAAPLTARPKVSCCVTSTTPNVLAKKPVKENHQDANAFPHRPTARKGHRGRARSERDQKSAMRDWSANDASLSLIYLFVLSHLIVSRPNGPRMNERAFPIYRPTASAPSGVGQKSSPAVLYACSREFPRGSEADPACGADLPAPSWRM